MLMKRVLIPVERFEEAREVELPAHLRLDDGWEPVSFTTKRAQTGWNETGFARYEEVVEIFFVKRGSAP